MRYNFVLLSALTVLFVSCDKREDIFDVSTSEQSVSVNSESVDLSNLRILQSRGFFQDISIKENGDLRGLSHKESEVEKITFKEFFESNDAIIAVHGSLENPFMDIQKISLYNELTERQKEVISYLAENETIQNFFLEALRYYQSKGKEESLRNFVYSQLLYSGPKHANMNKEILKFVGVMATAAGGTYVGTPIAAAIAAGAGYLLSLW